MYDLPIGYWRSLHKILSEEKEINPEWAMTLTGLKDSENKLKKKDEEIRLADTVIAASSFTAKTLSNFPGVIPQIKIVPYGFPDVSAKEYKMNTSGKLKFLFCWRLIAAQRIKLYV